ncbi:hypothetical protein BZG29_17155 [Janthinobacterium sp. LM6]|nr:hypothetical protein BZG29_17155 [Janthinobacterium sp. LM6]
MTVSEFWHQAFLAALHRVPADQAKVEADLATSASIEHWQGTHNGGMQAVWTPLAELKITDIRRQSNDQDG